MTDKVQKIREEIEKIKTAHSSIDLKESNPDILVVQVCTNLLSFIDSLQEEPKTDWLQELQKRLDSLSKEDFKNVMAKYSRYGEEEPVSMWHDVSEEPVSEELDIAATEYSSQNKFFLKPTDVLAFDSLSCCAKDSFIIGANWQKEQLMASGTDVTVHVDAGGYPYIPQIELYDYDKDIPLAKEGDKYKVVLIKED